jgi:integrase/recombinase XerD
MLMSDAVNGFLLMKATEFSPATLDIYRWALNRMVIYLEDPEISHITSDDLHKFFYYLQYDYKPVRKNKDTTPLKPRSIENAWTAMRSFFNWATTELELKQRPDENIKRPKYRPAEIVPFSEDEVKQLLKVCEHTSPASTTKRRPFVMKRHTAKRDLALILILLDTGLRVSECARLRVMDVNLENGEIFVKPWGTGQKTKSRVVIIGKSTRKALWLSLVSRGEYCLEDPLFVTRDNRPMDRNSIRLVLAELGKRAGIMNVHPHRFRHTFAIQFLRNGGDIYSLMRILGHSSMEMCKNYLSLAKLDLQNAHRIASPVDKWKL